MATNELTETWDRFISGDDKAFVRLYKAHTQFLYAYGMRFTSDSELVKDCIHDLFLKLYRDRKTIVRPQNIKVYLLVAFKNRLYNALNRSSRFQGLHSDEQSFSFIHSVEEEFLENEAGRMERERVESVLSVLSPRQREIIYYRYIQELTLQEICLLMELNYQSVQNLIQKALAKARSHLNVKNKGKGV